MFLINRERKKAEHFIAKVTELEGKVAELIENDKSGYAIDLSELADGPYCLIKEIADPEGDEKIIAILPDPDDHYEIMFVKVELGQIVPEKFEVKDGKIILTEKEKEKN